MGKFLFSLVTIKASVTNMNPIPKPQPKDKSSKQLTCIQCGSKQVVNRTHSLCYEHNQERLKGKDWKEVKLQAHIASLKSKESKGKQLILKTSQEILKQVSSTNSFYTSNGEKIKKSIINARTRESKRLILEAQLFEFGYNFCVNCGINSSSGVPIDCSHIISVDECQKTRRAELAWDKENIKPLCRFCHQKHDKNYLYSL